MAPPGRLTDKIAIVTGSSSGVGRAIAIRYALEGASIVCADLRPEARSEIPNEMDVTTDELIRQRGNRAIFVKTNVGVVTDMEELVAKTVAEYGRLDILVNNAGIALESKDAQPVHTTSEKTWDLTMQVNTKSIFLGCKYAIAQMLKQDPHSLSGDRGWIINIASILGLVGGPHSPSYCASKAAACGLTKQVALDYAADRIHCNAICPGYTQTAIWVNVTKKEGYAEDLNRKHPFGGAGKPDDIAKVAVTLASDDASWMTGTCVPVDGGYTAH